MAIQFPKSIVDAVQKIGFSSQKSSGGQLHRRIGLNIGRSNLVACELLEQSGQHVLERCGRQALVKDKPLPEQIKDFFKGFNFQSKQVRVSLKGQGIVVRFLSFPRMNKQDFASSIQFEAEKYLPFNLSEVVIDFHINDTLATRGENATTMPVILVAVRKTEVNKIIDTVKLAGLEPSSIDLDTFACVNAFEFANPDAKSKVLGLVDFGAEDTTFMIWNKGALVFSRDIAFGGKDLTETIKRKLNVSFEEALKVQTGFDNASDDQKKVAEESLERIIHELSLSLSYYYNHHQGTAPIEALYISGGFSQFPILAEVLHRKIEVPVNTWDPTSGLTLGSAAHPDTVKSLAPYLAVSMGLAIRPK